MNHFSIKLKQIPQLMVLAFFLTMLSPTIFAQIPQYPEETPTYLTGKNPLNLTQVGLFVVRCHNSNCTTITTTPVHINTSSFVNMINGNATLTEDPNGNAVVAYNVSQNGTAAGSLYFRRCLDVDCTTISNPIVIAQGTGNGYPYPNKPTVGFGSDGLPVIVYAEFQSSPTTRYDIKYVHCSNLDCSGTNTINTIGVQFDGFSFSSSPSETIAMDRGPDGFMRIAYGYQNTILGPLSAQLRLITCTNLTCSSHTEVSVKSTIDMTSADMRYDEVTGHTYITHANIDSSAQAGGGVYLVDCQNSNCTTGITDSLVNPAGDRIVDMAENVNGQTQLLYYEYTPQPSVRPLAYALCTNPDCSTVASNILIDPTTSPGTRGMYFHANGKHPRAKVTMAYTDAGTFSTNQALCNATTCATSSVSTHIQPAMGLHGYTLA